MVGDISTITSLDKINLCEQVASTEGAILYCKLQELLNALEIGNFQVDDMVEKAELIRVSAEHLENEGEQKIIGITASILKHSVRYWNEKYEKIYQKLKTKCPNLLGGILKRNIDTNSAFYNQFNPENKLIIVNQKFSNTEFNSANSNYSQLKMNWWAIAGSDAMGAFRWGRVGLVAAGGPAGAIACGFAGACGHSLASLIVQGVINH